MSCHAPYCFDAGRCRHACPVTFTGERLAAEENAAAVGAAFRSLPARILLASLTIALLGALALGIRTGIEAERQQIIIARV